MKARSFKSILLAVASPLSSIVLCICVSDAVGQERAAQTQQSNYSGAAASSGKEVLGPTADSIRPYKPAGRDPFKKVIKPKATVGKTARLQRPLGFPSLDMRRTEYRQKVDQARSRELPEPDPLSQYLVSELEITGIFRDQNGFGAFVRAQPTGTMFFIRRGTPCYNGEVLRIEGDESDVGGAKVLFRELSYLEINGKQSPQERVVVKLPGTQEKK